MNKKKTKPKKKKLSLAALGFNKKPDTGRKGYVNSNTVRDRWKQILSLLAANETTPDL